VALLFFTVLFPLTFIGFTDDDLFIAYRTKGKNSKIGMLG